MNLTVLNSSIVVVAESHNPSILHPSFLSSQKIVPENWEPAERPVSTPAISVIKYSNGISFVCEPNRFQIRNLSPKKEDLFLPELATKYLEVLPHVRYSAVGINFEAFMECSEPSKFLSDRFLKPGSLSKVDASLQRFGINLTYDVGEGTLGLKCDPGFLSREDSKENRPCILVHANYHSGIPDNERLKECIRTISLYQSRVAHFETVVQILFGLEEQE